MPTSNSPGGMDGVAVSAMVGDGRIDSVAVGGSGVGEGVGLLAFSKELQADRMGR